MSKKSGSKYSKIAVFVLKPMMLIKVITLSLGLFKGTNVQAMDTNVKYSDEVVVGDMMFAHTQNQVGNSQLFRL
jgi:hypothetical protein